MDTILAYISAFIFHRVPPIIKALDDGQLDLSTPAGRRMLARIEVAFGCIPVPLHLLVWDRERSFSSKNIIGHVWSGEVPAGGIQEVTSTLSVTSPLFTLLQMAPRLPRIELVMALCELCGWFSVYHVTQQQREALGHATGRADIPPWGGWRVVTSQSGEATDLWMHPPLVSRADILSFADEAQGLYGARKFARAAQLVVENAASPFEVQTALRLGLPRREGGLGIHGLRLNERIALSPRARELTDQRTCYADILIRGRAGNPPVIVECQSELVHDDATRALSDTKRMAALQAMGYVVLPITFDQIADPWLFRQFADHLLRLLGERPCLWDDAFERKAAELCRDLFIDWRTLGASAVRPRGKRPSASRPR